MPDTSLLIDGLKRFWASQKRSLRATQVICLSVAAFLWAMGSPLLVAVVYSLLIGNLTATLIHVQLFALGDWRSRARNGGTGGEFGQWPGWPVTIAAVGIGVVLGYLLGVRLAGLLLGLVDTAPRARPDGVHALRVLAISLVPAVVGTLFFRSRALLAQAQTQAAEARSLAAETQLKLLESQLEPHMLFNTLANLRALVSVDPDRAQTMLDHLIDYLRATLSASRLSQHPLATEFARVADYLALMQVRMGPRLQIECRLPPDLARVPVPPLLLQPLVENAIKHGLEPVRGPASLQVSAEVSAPGRLCLKITDTGVGLRTSAATPGSGFGLAQVRERLKTLYGAQAGLSLSPGPQGGTVATVWLPLETPIVPAGRPSMP